MSSENKSSIIANIYNARNILLDQLGNMNYNVVSNMEVSVNEVNSMYKNKQLDMILEQNKSDKEDYDNLSSKEDNNSKTKIYVHFHLNKSLRPNNIQEMIEELYNVEEILSKKDILYIVLKDEPNETLVNSIKQIWDEEGIFIILQNISRLQFNILDHSLVPKHRIIVSESEREIIKKKYNIMEDSQLPEISRFDPVAQVICARPGDMIEIIRPSRTAIETKYYRICI